MTASGRGRVLAAVSGVVLFVAFVGLGLLVRDTPSRLDAAVSDELRGAWQGTVGDLGGVVSVVLGPALAVVVGLALVVGAIRCLRRGDRTTATLLGKVLALLAVCRATSWLAKPLFERSRPREYPDFSYPSGHVVSVASAAFAVVVLCLWLAPALARLASWLSAAAVVLCAASRVALDVHWLTDTLGAALAVGGAGLVFGAAVGLVPVARRGVLSSS